MATSRNAEFLAHGSPTLDFVLPFPALPSQALCAEKNVPIREVPEAKTLGELVGLCKLDKEGKARKVVSTSVAVITDFGESSKALDMLLDDLRSQGKL